MNMDWLGQYTYTYIEARYEHEHHAKERKGEKLKAMCTFTLYYVLCTMFYVTSYNIHKSQKCT